ncbi:MAG TPA: nuclear transport factor 2 family protein [Flavilitoribacter sp.]|nr:nuclear transport factor 2 family protein [Flavilitoribacter sp.]HMQ91402.1 nuclear transport factor 2 family protein [Flavilitoribacter sp.]
MKSLFSLMVLLAGSFTVFSNLQAQSISDELEIQAFTRNFLVAYNAQDLAGLQKMYTEYAVRIDADGKETTGADQIADYFSKQFINNNTTLLLKPSGIVWSDAEHAFVARGTYEIFGNTHVYDIKIHESGAYFNTMIKEKDEWKIGKTVLAPLVKVVVYHKVKDFTEWKWAFKMGQPMRFSAGELSSEIGVLRDDPTTAYVISEWISLERFQAYFANPDLAKAMQEAGVIGKPTVMVLDGE